LLLLEFLRSTFQWLAWRLEIRSGR
jgi:hypothetical protein